MKEAGSGSGPGAGRDGADEDSTVVDMVRRGDGCWVKMLGKAGYG
jgi:hypothetical protein